MYHEWSRFTTDQVHSTLPLAELDEGGVVLIQHAKEPVQQLGHLRLGLAQLVQKLLFRGNGDHSNKNNNTNDRRTVITTVHRRRGFTRDNTHC